MVTFGFFSLDNIYDSLLHRFTDDRNIVEEEKKNGDTKHARMWQTKLICDKSGECLDSDLQYKLNGFFLLLPFSCS